MKFWEAMKALEEGKRVRRIDWKPGVFLVQHGKHIYGSAAGLLPYKIGLESTSFAWELYKESSDSGLETAALNIVNAQSSQ